jgi:hypothetical protein
MTPDAFRTLALQLPDVVEDIHMNHPDFRVRGKIFATLGYPTREFAAVMLTPAEQAAFIDEGSGAFLPVRGAWGVKGSTSVRLKHADPQLVKRALAAAWIRKCPKPTRRRGGRRTRAPS